MKSDEYSDQPYYSNDELEEESFFIQSVLPTKMRKKKCVEDLRQPRQKFLAKWEQDFPWLKADKMDQSIGICTVCNKQLVCKKSHMERHEKSFKHMRMQGGFDPATSIDADNMQPTAPEFLECGKREFEDADDFENTIEMDPGTANEEFEAIPAKRAKREVNTIPKKKPSPVGKQKRTAAAKSVPTSTPLRKSSAGKLNRYKLLKRIDRDRQELNDYYYAQKQLYAPTTPQSRDSFDLFFESVSASVKTLPPKLAAELKSRVSQIVAEFELRAICEREELQNSAASAENVAVASTTHEVATDVVAQEHISTSIDGSAVPHIIYTFQPKIRE